jgi:hypothetical protein
MSVRQCSIFLRSYSCNDPSQEMVNLASGNVSASVVSTCMFNGVYSVDILNDYACTGGFV